ncbi:MAG TPA: VOC family protein [Trueperaceae bacterium]|nr:VOC family protein [Trueperaceae bacterium]
MSDMRLGPIGQISRRVSDIDAAVAWYRDVLLLPHLYTYGDLAFFDAGGTRLFLSAVDEGAGEKGESVLYFRVADIHAVSESLSSRGVVFTSAPHLIHRHESGVEEWMAFFTDPDGHVLALMAQTPPDNAPTPSPEA